MSIKLHREFESNQPGQGWLATLVRAEKKREPVFDPSEVAALIKFASENGIDSDDHLVARLYFELLEYEKDPQSTAHITRASGQELEVLYAALVIEHYAKLTKLTSGVNGRNLVFGRRLGIESRYFLMFTIATFIICILSLAVGDWVNQDGHNIGSEFWSLAIHYVLFFTPFFWGSLGACIYILKRISDEAGANRFDPDKFQGWFTKATLGAVLGGSITYIIDPSTFGQATLSTTSVAFLTGLGTKVVYGALERLIELLSDKMNLNSMRVQKVSDKDAVSRFLADWIAELDPGKAPEKYKVLVELLEQNGERPG